MLPFETGDFYIEIFLLAIKPSSLREGRRFNVNFSFMSGKILGLRI